MLTWRKRNKEAWAHIMKGDSKNELHGEGRERSKAPGRCIYDYSISLQQDVGGGGFHGNQ